MIAGNKGAGEQAASLSLTTSLYIHCYYYCLLVKSTTTMDLVAATPEEQAIFYHVGLVYRGRIVHATEDREIEILDDHVLGGWW